MRLRDLELSWAGFEPIFQTIDIQDVTVCLTNIVTD